VAAARDGEQNDTLNRAAFALGQLVGADVLDRLEAQRRLLEAAARYIQKDGPHAAQETIKSGLDAGQLQPRDLSGVGADRDGAAGEHAGAEAVPLPWPPLRFSEPPPALPFPVDIWPPILQEYCRELAQATLGAMDFVGMSMLAVAGAAIGQSVNILVKPGWTEAAVLFAILVADPGRVKSPVVREVVKPLAEIDRQLREESKRAREEWEAAREKKKKDEPPGPAPPQSRAVVKDITRESLAIILADNPRGVLCDPDEVSGWVNGFNEYKGRSGSDRQFWLSTWSSTPISVDRKGGRESTYVPFPFVSVLGGLPPGMLDSLRDEKGRNDGFLDRLLFCFPDSFPPQRWTEQVISPEATAAWSHAIQRLFTTPMRVEEGERRPNLVSFDDAAKIAWVQWFNEHSAELDDPDFHDRHMGAFSKLRSHAARFVLIISRVRLACVPREATAPGKWNKPVGGEHPDVTAADVHGAIELVRYFKSHMLRVGHRMTAGTGNVDAKALVAWIKRREESTFREADARHDLKRFRQDPADLARAIDVLKAMGAIRPRSEPSAADKRGRPPTPAYDVHPDLLGGSGDIT
jgi:hypothetical protein